jgi:hypothetical protein
MPVAQPIRPSQGEFEAWASGSPQRREDYRAFAAYLKSQGVADILPPWSLLVPDRQYVSAKCPVEAFVMPPKSQWPRIVPTLRYIRTQIVPAIGPVRVSSAFRSPSFNACIGGAPKSAHLSFSALDLVTITPSDRPAMFEKLCTLWRASPPSQNVGLGTYFSLDQPNRNPIGRFHIDTLGKRSWGFDFRGTSSFCRAQ